MIAYDSQGTGLGREGKGIVQPVGIENAQSSTHGLGYEKPKKKTRRGRGRKRKRDAVGEGDGAADESQTKHKDESLFDFLNAQLNVPSSWPKEVRIAV
jgi:hypothetical protein